LKLVQGVNPLLVAADLFFKQRGQHRCCHALLIEPL
jgi:hypothetical protein